MAKRGGKSYIQLNLEGFDELLHKIEEAGGSINKSCETCIKRSADIQQQELQAQMRKARVPSDLIARMPPPSIEVDGNRFTARVGYKKGDYTPDNLSDGYKVVFLNYGTPRVKPRGFIKKAKNVAKKPIKKMQEDTLKKILGDLKK